MEMVDMKGKVEKLGGCCPVDSGKAEYPWGLSVTLESEALEALDINPAAFRVGETVRLTCDAKITNMSENSSETYEDGKPRCSMSLQICRMAKPSVTKENRMQSGANVLKHLRDDGPNDRVPVGSVKE